MVPELKNCLGSSAAASGGVGHRQGSDPVLLWLWCRPTAAAPIQPLAWESSYAKGVALKKKKQKRKTVYLGIITWHNNNENRQCL